MKILTDSRIWVIKIIVLLALILLATIGIVSFLASKNTHKATEKACCESCKDGKRCDSEMVSQNVPTGTVVKDNIKTTLDDLDTSTTISKRTDAVDEIIRKKTKPKKIIPEKQEVSKIKSKDGAVELSIDKLNVLPPDENKLPQIDVVGGVEIHLDKPKKAKNKKLKDEVKSD